jgi:hypothetical protein
MAMAKEQLRAYFYGRHGVIDNIMIANTPKAIRLALSLGYAVEQPDDKVTLPDYTRVPVHHLLIHYIEMLERGVISTDLMGLSRRERGV